LDSAFFSDAGTTFWNSFTFLFWINSLLKLTHCVSDDLPADIDYGRDYIYSMPQTRDGEGAEAVLSRKTGGTVREPPTQAQAGSAAGLAGNPISRFHLFELRVGISQHTK
jgi:hypothetical protein